MANGESFRRLAVLIDGDNISSDHADKLFQEVAKLGIPKIRRVYGSLSSLAGWRTKAKRFWIGMHKVLPGKNATDMKLVIDAVDILHRKRVDGYCIVSSDRDFTALANRLSDDGVRVVGFGRKDTAASFRNACHEFVELEVAKAPIAVTAKVAKPAKAAANPASSTKRIAEAKGLLTRAIGEVGGKDGWATLNAISQSARVISPDFTPRAYGSSTLKGLIQACGFELRGKGSGMSARAVHQPQPGKPRAGASKPVLAGTPA